MATSAIDDEALKEWKKAREVERLNAQQKQESNETVPLRLSGSLQIFVPTELLVVLHSLWERVKIEPESDTFAHDIKVWAALLKLVSEITPEANNSANSSNTLSPASRHYLMRVAFDNLAKSLRGVEIHAATRGFPEQQEILHTYFAALAALGAPAERAAASAQKPSALLTLANEGHAGIFATFGGQGAAWLPEFRILMNTYPALRGLVDRAQAAFNAQVAAIKAPELYPHGTDFVAWASDASSAPPSDYLASSPISWPLIGLTQLLHYHVTVLLWRAQPSDVLRHIKGMAGHSQGSTAAVVAAISTTIEELANNTVQAVRLLASIGARLQQATPFQAAARADIAQESVSSGWGAPSPMMSVVQLPAERLKKYVEAANKTMAKDDPERLLEIALRNGPRNAVVVGHPEALHALNKLLHTAEAGRAANGTDQTRVPYSKRQLEFRSVYLNVSAPFHSQLLLQSAAAPLTADVRALALTWQAAALRVPVYSTVDGADLRKSADLLTDLLRMQTVQPVDWPLATASISRAGGVTHVVDFGPGGSGNTLARNLLGQGVQVVMAGVAQAPDEGAVGAACGKWALTESRTAALPSAPHWAVQYAPRLVRRQGDGKLIVHTRMTDLLGKPPLMVAGMTPTTVSAPIVAAALNAGYHAELAGGGLPSEKMYRDRIAEVARLAAPGWAVTPNLLFLNQRLWGFQFPLSERLAADGWPIEGITVAAGVPSVERSAEIVAAVHRSGMRHVGFKPGSAPAILQVVDIARAHPDVAIILQWTGGRGGGHHSFEDMHEPILATYSEIRTCPNITLIAGSGFGDSDDSWPYLTGEWSLPLGHAAMPYDGVLIGSRVMVAKEAATAREAKELLVQTPGVEKEALWEQSYEGIAGGVITVRSELGEPIHKVATRGLLLWREFDREIFTLPPEKAAAKIAERKDYIIRRLNNDYQKPYFGRHLDGSVCGLDEMTYEEVARRLVDLSFVPPVKPTTDSAAPARAGRWLHADFMVRVWDLGVRIEERFAADHTVKTATSTAATAPPLVSRLLPQAKLASEPREWLEHLLTTAYPGARAQLMCSEDVDWFIALCRTGGRKPVNFVPVIDRDLESWFKKDSLWQSEDLDAVPGRDVGRVVILQGPVAVRYSRTVDEPVADILNGIHDGWVRRLLADKAYSAGVESVPTVEYVGGPAARAVSDADIGKHRVTATRAKKDADTDTLTAQVQDERALPERDEWFDWLAGAAPSWWRALLTAPHIVRGNRRAANYVRRLFEPRARTVYHITRVKGRVTEVHVRDASADAKPALHVACTAAGDITVTLFHARQATGEALSLFFRLQYHPEQGTAPLHEADPERKARVKRFYADMWLAGVSVPPPVGPPKAALYTSRFVVSRPAVEAFVRSIGRPVQLSSEGRVRVPLDFAIVVGWEAIMRALLSESIEGDVLQLVHASNAFELLAPRGLQDGDSVVATAKLHELVPAEAGTRVTVDCALALPGGQTVASIRSSFLFRGEAPPKGGFRRTSEVRFVALQSKEQLAVLRSKPWFTWTAEPRVGDRLVFRLQAEEDTVSAARINVACTGTVHRAGLRLDEGEQVATVAHAAQDVAGDAASAFVRRFARLLSPPVFFEAGGYAALQTPDVTAAPADNGAYAAASTDFNPIHTNAYFASIAALPTTVTHGMWASANARRVVEGSVAKHRPERITSFAVDFVGYVRPRDRLTTHVRHVGMRAGALLLEVRTENAAGEPVVKGKAEVRGSATAYVFTGQGSAEVGMGMDLYAASPLARRIWNTADAFLLERYGFSILQIVKENPKSIELTFGGTRGEAMRANYKNLYQEAPVRQADGSVVVERRPLFTDITDLTASYTFSHPEGLLFATQFSQPALVLFELAAFEDMRERGLVPDDCFFAGHSLGEYAALASVASVLSIEALTEIVFLRGITMQNAVQRDKLGRSQYAMVAVNPARVHPTRFREPQLQQVIAAITAVRPELLQVVNYNVDNYQYVVAGERGNLRALSYILDEIRKDPASSASRMEAIAKGALQAVADARDPESGWIELERGTATIPLPGIDVPFHSRFLANGVPAFRQILDQRVTRESIDERKLVGRYIPNVTATPFSLAREYVQGAQKDTQSPELAAVLQDFDAWAAKPQALAHKLVIELLAYQFASPVRWIETQHLFFTSLHVERLIEVGPAPTLLTMAKRTLEMGAYSPLVQREILWYNRDKQAIYYQHADEAAPPPAPAPDAAPAAPAQAAPAPAHAKSGNGHAHGGHAHGHAQTHAHKAAATATSTSAAPAAPSAPAARPAAAAAGKSASAPLTALDVLRVMLALKLKRSVPLVPATTSIREAVGGKSALQNELIGDVAKEFGSEPEGAADMDLNSLASRFPNYARLGQLMAAQVGRMVAAKLPGGMGLAALRTQLAAQYGFTDETVDAVLVHMLASQPAQRLQTEGEANQWLGTVVADFAAARGIAIAAAGGADTAGEGRAVAVVDSAALAAAEKRQQSLARDHMRALQAYIGDESPAAQQQLAATEAAKAASDAALRLWVDEHGEAYAEGIRPAFDAKKERRYSSFWNWALQDCLTLYYDYACGRATRWGNDIRERLYHIKNRATPRLVTNIQFYLQKAEQDGRPEITRFIHILIDVVRSSIDEAPKYRELALPTAPHSDIDDSGVVRYREVSRQGAKDMSGYVQSLATPAPLAASAAAKAHAPREAAAAKLMEALKGTNADLKALEAHIRELSGPAAAAPPQVFVRTPDPLDPSARSFDPALTNSYLSVLQKIASEGVTFQKKVALVTGCGKGSIGLEIVKGLLRGGAKVYATTSRWSAEGLSLYNSLYDDHGGKFSELVVVPFNQASQQDVHALVDFIYDKEKEDLDFIVPFAALSENGRDLGAIDSHSELAHRLMLTNLLRLVGAVKNKKEAKKIVTHPAHVLLPLSPNHGIFGSDGLYAEGKLGLEALLNKWHSEGWAAYLTLAGAVIGWTRGTALMQSNNVLAAGIEKLGARTFSTKEMCFNLLGLLHPAMVSEAQRQPLWADLNGSLHLVRNLHTVVGDVRAALQESAALHKAVASDRALDAEVASGAPRADAAVATAAITPRANVRVPFPELPSEARLRDLSHLRGMLDLDKVIVVTGFGEVGPFGSSRTRWEMEAHGEFSLEGCIELAWSMGLIKYHKDAQWTGWVDAKTKERVRDHLVKSKYEELLLRHTGIRVVEAGMHEGYDPLNKTFLHTVALDKDGPEVECSAEDAKHLRQQHGDKVDVATRGGTTYFRLRKGAVMYVPKSMRTDRFVAGQVPTTWDPAAFGVPQDIIAQVDRVTLYSLVSVVEAMVAAGVSDPYEFYEYVHMSEIANTIGSGMGGANAIKKMHVDRMFEKPVQADVLQETFINTMPAWLNLLLLSASGPIKTPVGACATAVESVELGVEAIRSGRARIAFVGGYDDYGEHGAYEFAQMKATINNEADMAAGRTAREQSRPATSTRAGFVEAQGAGTQILMSASLAVKMGVPIYAVVEHVATAMDKIGRSVPAPGRGILTTARESTLRYPTPLLDLQYRRRQLDADLAAARAWHEREREAVRAYVTAQAAALAPDAAKAMEAEQEAILAIEYNRRLKLAHSHWGNDFYVGNPHIAPLRGALAVYGLTVDDLAVASFHGTSTKGNDYNESQVLQHQLEHLGRTPGNLIMSVWQKYLTGHPKGAAAAWMLNGLIQSMLSGVVPGNRNADNIDAQFQKFDHIAFLNRSLHTYGFKAGLLKSFGFGQVGGEVLVIHPDFVLAQLEPEAYVAYTRHRAIRNRAAFRHWQDALVAKAPFVRVKHDPPYLPADEQKVLLNPLARAQYNKDAKTWRYAPSKVAQIAAAAAAATAPPPSSPSMSPRKEAPVEAKEAGGMRRALSHTALTHLEVTLRELQHGLRDPTLDRGLGVDAQLISEIEVSISNSDFVSRNFTAAEIAYCRAAADPSSSFAGRWAAKEAVIKAISSSDAGEQTRNLWSGGGAPLRDIEVLPSGSGAPKVVLHGYVREVATLLGISSVKVSISHSGEYAIAQAVAR